MLVWVFLGAGIPVSQEMGPLSVMTEAEIIPEELWATLV